MVLRNISKHRIYRHNKNLMFEAIHLLAAEDVGVTSIQDGHGAAAEELTASGTELNL